LLVEWVVSDEIGVTWIGMKYTLTAVCARSGAWWAAAPAG